MDGTGAGDPSRRELARRFLEVIDRHKSHVDPRVSTVWLPTHLARAAAEVLSADGAVLSVVDGPITVPIGVSDPAAAAVERLQFTVGEGPFLTAVRTMTNVVADTATHVDQWPVLAEEVNRTTRFRSVLALPFRLGAEVRAVLELYFADSAGASQADVSDALVVLGIVATRLLTDGPTACNPVAGGLDPDRVAGEASGPPWVVGGIARMRLRIWMVVGMVMSRTGLTPHDSLGLLRAVAFSRGQQVDSLCAAVIQGQLTLDSVLS